jgi:hypothetical protein
LPSKQGILAPTGEVKVRENLLKSVAPLTLASSLAISSPAQATGAIPQETLGKRNNNPINLKAFEKWDGMSGKDKQGHAIFKDLDHGIRAGLKNLKNHQRKNQEQTLVQYLNSFAEANGTAEAKFIANELGITTNSKLKDINMDSLIIPMAKFESKISLTAKDIARVKEKFGL